MGRILFGVLLGALAAFTLTAVIIWLAPLLASGVVVCLVWWLAKRPRLRGSDDFTPGPVEPMQSANPIEPDILLLTDADRLL